MGSYPHARKCLVPAAATRASAGAVCPARRTCGTALGDRCCGYLRPRPLGRRTTRQNDGCRHPGRRAYRHRRVRSRCASKLGVGRHGPCPALLIRATQTQDSVTVVCLTARGIADCDGAMSYNEPLSRRSSKPPNRSGKSGRYLKVRNCDSEYGLSLLVCGRLCDLVTPRSASRWATGLAIIGDPRSECKVSWSLATP